MADCRSRIWIAHLLVVALVACAALARTVGADEVIERVLAVAGGEVITQSDVTAARELGLVPVDGTQPPAAQTRQIVGKLIDRALMLAEVDRYAPPEPPEERVSRELSRVRARFTSDGAFAAALARAGLDEEYLRDILRQNLRIQAYIDERFAVPDGQRQPLIDEWVKGLRRRSTITELDPAGVPAAP